MRKLTILVPIIGLVIIAGSFCTYLAKTQTFYKDIGIKLATGLTASYKEYTGSRASGTIEPREFGELIKVRLPTRVFQKDQSLSITIVKDSVSLGSHNILCVVGYKERVYVGIRGDGERVFLNKEQFVFWRRETAAVTLHNDRR